MKFSTGLVLVAAGGAVLLYGPKLNLGNLMPGLNVNVGSVDVGSFGKKKPGPVTAKVREVRIVEMHAAKLTPASYIKAQVWGAEAHQKIDISWQPDAHPSLKLKKGKAIIVDTQLGYDETKADRFFKVKRGAGRTATLYINPAGLVPIRPAVVPFVNQYKTTCDDDRLHQVIMDSGSCHDLEAGLLDAAVAAFSVGCLKKNWNYIKSQVAAAQKQRYEYLYQWMKRYYPNVTWHKLKLKVVFSPDRPAFSKIPSGWAWRNSHGKPWHKGDGAVYLEHKVKHGNKTDTFKVDLTKLRCTVSKKALKRSLRNAATRPPVTPTS